MRTEEIHSAFIIDRLEAKLLATVYFISAPHVRTALAQQPSDDRSRHTTGSLPISTFSALEVSHVKRYINLIYITYLLTLGRPQVLS